MCRNAFILLLAALLLIQLPVHAQTQAGKIVSDNIVFHRITTEQGLAGDAITCLLQDKKGFLWIGTNNGLCRYDGSSMTIFRNNPKDPFSISDNVAISLMLDKNDNLWAGTYWKGLNRFDEGRHQFIRYNNDHKKLFANNSIHAAQFIDSNNILIAQTSLLIFNIKNQTSRFIELPMNTWAEKKSTMLADVFEPYHLFIDHEKKCWLAGESGVVQYDPVSKKINLPCLRKDVSDDFKNKSAWDCKEDIHGNIWVGGVAGLCEFEKATGRFIEHYPSRFAAADSKTDFVKNILCDEDGSIWFGTDNGLFHYFPATGHYAVFRNHPRHSLSISDNNISCLYKDKQNILWVGTQNGLNAIYPQTSAFKIFQSIPGEKESLQSNITRSSFKDDNGNVWVGTAAGLDCIDPVTKIVSHYRYHDPQLKNKNDYNVMAILQHDNDRFWVGTWSEGLQLFDFRKKKFIASFTHSSDDPKLICSNYIKSLCKDDRGNLWIATWNGGIDRFDPIKKTFEHYNTRNGLQSDYISKIYFAANHIWAGTGFGLLQYEYASDRFSFQRILKDTTDKQAAGATSFGSDEKGNLWIGTFKGLIKYDIGHARFEKIPAFENESILGIYSQPDHSLWLATGNGLKLYNPATGKIVNYTLKDGLPISYFPLDCFFYQSEKGELFINSNNGLIHFFPGDITRNTSIPSMQFTSIKIANKELEGTGSMNTLQKLDLRHDQDYLSISFTAFNFINPTQNQYAYYLEGIDKDWVYAGNRNEAVYNSLPAGDYLFRVKASNDAGIWNEKGISLQIHVHTAWWRSWWFYSLCLLTGIAIIYTIYKIRINQIIAEHKLRNKIARDLHDDIGSTLSGIKLFSSMAHTKLVQEKSDAVGIIERIGERSEKMMDAMSDIVWSINPKNDSFENMLIRMRQYAAEMLEPKNISYTFLEDETPKKLKLSLEARKNIYLIFKESINNIIKHANCKNVKIEMKQKGNALEMHIADDGEGFNRQDLKAGGNGLTNFYERAKNMRATVDVASEKNTGTRLTLCIPLTP